MRARYWTLLAVVLLAMALSATACAKKDSGNGDAGTNGKAEPAKGPVTIGSKVDVEGPILAQIMIALLEDNGFKVVDKTRTGTTKVVRDAIIAGEIDGYPEYTANAAVYFYPEEKASADVLRDAQKTYEVARDLDLKNNNIVWFAPAPANNTWAVAIPKSFSSSNAILTLEDFAEYVNEGGKVKVAGSEEFFQREDAMPAFEKAYGFKLKADQKVVLATGDTSLTEKAAAEGTDGVNAAMAYGTDGSIAAFGLVVLGDPKAVQPIYQPAPIFRKETADAYPEIETILGPAFEKLDLVTLQELNGKVQVEGQDEKTVAREWLVKVGLLK